MPANRLRSVFFTKTRKLAGAWLPVPQNLRPMFGVAMFFRGFSRDKPEPENPSTRFQSFDHNICTHAVIFLQLFMVLGAV